MSEEFVNYNGVQMIRGWPAMIEAAQLQPTVIIGGTKHERIRYGKEAGGLGC
jgi:hypothetical protein